MWISLISCEYCIQKTLWKVNYIHDYVYQLLTSPHYLYVMILSDFTPHPIQPPSIITEHPARLPALHRSFPLAVCFIHDGVYMSVLLSQFVPPPPSPTVPTCPFSLSASPLLACGWVYQYHFSRFHIFLLIHDSCFSISDLLYST